MTDQERQERMEKMFEKMLNMEMTNREMYEQCRNVAHEPMTNEEYLRSCNTEELAIFICNNLPQETEGTLENRFWNALYSQYPIEPMNAYHEVMKWLKEKHE